MQRNVTMHSDKQHAMLSHKLQNVRSEVLKAVTMKNAVFWDVTLCGSTTQHHVPADSIQVAKYTDADGGIFENVLY
jgi:hypothetical protein